MSRPGPEPGGLEATLRGALQSTEPASVPAFDHVWSRARAAHKPGRAGWLGPAVAVATLAAVAVLVYLQRPPTPDDDYRLAVALVAAHARGTPTDRWLEQAPSSPVTGLPSLPVLAYPLIPEEAFL